MRRAGRLEKSLNAGSPDASARNVAGFRKGLNESGYIEGQNVTVDYHWLDGQCDRLPAIIAELVRRRVAVIASAGDATAPAVKAATARIPCLYEFIVSIIRIISGGLIEFVRPRVDDRVLVEVVHCSHDAILEFLFGCDADVAQHRASLEKKPSMRLSQEPWVGVQVNSKRCAGCCAIQVLVSLEMCAE